MVQSPRTAQDCVDLLTEIRDLMRLRGDNQFKVRAFEKASDLLRAPQFKDDLLARARANQLTELPGIGAGIAAVLSEFLIHGTASARDELAQALPQGLMELTQVPGLGPKKAMQVIEELGITTVGELEYACRENRLTQLKGFGEKVQQKILEGLAFLKASAGQQRLGDVLDYSEELLKKLQSDLNRERHPAVPALRVSAVGALRRKCEVLTSLDYLVELPSGQKASSSIQKLAEQGIASLSPSKLPIRLEYVDPEQFGSELARLTATPEHWRALKLDGGEGAGLLPPARTEDAFYAELGLVTVPPEARETGEEVGLARLGQQGWVDSLLTESGIRGVFHNHTTRSDGRNTLEEMVIEAKRIGLQFIGISDHSQSAFYAQGLKLPDLLEQEAEIKKIQDRHPEIRIFWGIESDILADGSLDYETRVLKRFDFVVASVHQRFGHDQATMTRRVCQALKNPATRFLGHPTGRLLLGRPPFELDMDEVIAVATENQVAIEVNSNPQRLDIDWRYGPLLRKAGTLVSVNPDAHDIEGLSDTRFGVAMARKALLPRAQIINAQDVASVEAWLRKC